MMEEFKCEFESEQDTLIVKVFGELDQSTADELKMKLNEGNAEEYSQLIFDLGGVDFMASAALSVFNFYQDYFSTRGAGQKLKIINADSSMMRVFELTRMNEIIEIFPA